MAELCRGIDANSPPWRGYYHHRHFVYATPGKLTFLAKSPRVEHDPVDDAKIAAILRDDPLLWNTYFLWEGAFEVEFVSDALLQGFWDSTYGKPFGPGYPERVLEAAHTGIASTIAFVRQMQGAVPAEARENAIRSPLGEDAGATASAPT